MRLIPLSLLLLAANATASMCAPSNLQSTYESSANVFRAIITGARFDAEGYIDVDFEITETFKGKLPFDKLRTSDSPAATVGVEYIFFVGDDGRFGSCSGNVQIVPGRRSPWLRILQAYKAQETPDLSSPWVFRHEDGNCLLYTDFLSTEHAVVSYLSLEYRYAAPARPVWTDDRLNQAGYTSAAVVLPTNKEPVGATVKLNASEREFVATWAEDALPSRSRGAFQLAGDDVRALAHELLHTGVVEVEGSLRRHPTLDGTVIRTTNAGNAIAEFLDCAKR